MEPINFVDPPNRPMDPAFKIPQSPVLYSNLLFVDVDDLDRLLVGSTDTSASFWHGSVQTFQSYSAYKTGKCSNYYNGSLVHAGKFVPKSNCVLIAEPQSTVRLLDVFDEVGDSRRKECVEHVETVKQISLWRDNLKALTVSDNHLSLWDLNSVKVLANMTGFHTHDVKSGDVKRSDPNVFASCGSDRRVLVWDVRTDVPATELYTNEFCELTSVAWNPAGGNVLAVGSAGGDVYLLDVAQPNEFLSVRHCYKAPVHKIAFNESGTLAVCGNANDVQVYNCSKNEFDLVCNIQEHGKYVRDVAWFNDTLYSCGFDSKIARHVL